MELQVVRARCWRRPPRGIQASVASSQNRANHYTPLEAMAVCGTLAKFPTAIDRGRRWDKIASTSFLASALADWSSANDIVLVMKFCARENRDL
jgi:hypothetical protein